MDVATTEIPVDCADDVPEVRRAIAAQNERFLAVESCAGDSIGSIVAQFDDRNMHVDSLAIHPDPTPP